MKIEILVSVDGEDTLFSDEVPPQIVALVKTVLPLMSSTPAEMAAIGIRRELMEGIFELLKAAIPDIEDILNDDCNDPDCAVCESGLKAYLAEIQDQMPTA